jgi:hypothetical protein
MLLLPFLALALACNTGLTDVRYNNLESVTFPNGHESP